MESRRLLTILALMLAGGLAVMIALFAAAPSRSAPPVAALVALAALVVGAVVVVAIVASIRSQSRATIRRDEMCARLGFTYVKSPGKGFLEPYRGLPGVTKSAAPKHLYSGRLDGRGLNVFQATYHVYTGQATVPVTHTYYVMEAPDWPQLSILPRRGLRRLLHLFGWGKRLELEHPRFNASFRVETIDDDFALTLLAPAMQAFLLEKPTVRWCIRRGRVCLIYSGALRIERMEQSLARLREFWSLVPPEMEYWRA